MGNIKYENIKGLTANDRILWEKDNIDELNSGGYSTLPDNDKNDIFKAWAFKAKFGKRPDYKTLSSYNSELKDSIYNAGLPEIEIPQLDNRSKELKQIEDIGKAFLLGQLYKEEASKLTETYDKWPVRGKKALEDFDKIATTVSPYYKKYKGTEYLPFSEEEKIKIAAEYTAAKLSFGEEEANNILRRKMQDTASKNQSIGEKVWNGFRGMGALTAGALIGTAGMLKGAIDYIQADRNTDLDNSFLDFMDHVIDNDWSRFGNDVMLYGSLIEANNKEAKENGKLSNIPIIRTTEEELGGILDNILSVNTIPELINQQGFTIASMLTGAGLSAISGKVFQSLKGATMAANKVGVISNLDKVNKVLKGLQLVLLKSNAFIIPAMVGTVEGVSEGLNTKLQFLEESKLIIASNLKKYIDEEFNKRLQNPEELSRLGYNPLNEKDLERLYNDIFKSYAPQYEESIKKAEENAAKAGIYNMGLNSVINGALNMTLKAGLLSQSVQEALRRNRLGNLFNSSNFRVNLAGKVTSNFNKINQAFNVLKEPAGEFTEEYLQSLTNTFTTGGAEYNLQTFIDNKYKGEGKDVVEESIANDLFAAALAAGESAISKETILAGIYGALSSGLGTPTINNKRGPAIRTSDESKLQYALRRSPIVYRNPIYEAIKELKELGEERSSTAQVLTDWILDPTNKAKYDGLVGTFNWAKSLEDAASSKDEFGYRNSVLGKTINDAMVLEKLKGTDYYNSFMLDLTKSANVEDGTQEATSLIQQYRNSLSNKESELDDSTILNTIKDNANKILNTINAITEESNNIDKLLGNAANEDTKLALIYGKLSIDKWRERATSLEDEFNKIEFPSTENSSLNDIQKEALVKYGSLNKVTAENTKLLDKISKLKEDISNIKNRKSLGLEEQSILKNKTALLKTLEKESKKLESIKESFDNKSILSASEIMQLNPALRALMLNPDNKSKYSEELQEIIDNIIKEGTLKYNDFLDKILDSGKINLGQLAYLTQYNNILSNPDSFNAFSNRIKQQVADDNTRKKYEFINKETDYSTFIKTLDKSYRDADIRERLIIRSILKDNPNYKKYIEDNKNLEGVFDQLELNKKFSNLSENEQSVLKASMLYLVDKGISVTDPKALETLSIQEENGSSSLINYINELNSRLPENMLLPTNIESILLTFKDVVESYSNNTKEVEKVIKPVKVTPTIDNKPIEPVIPNKGTSPSIFDKAAKSLEESELDAEKTFEDTKSIKEDPKESTNNEVFEEFKLNSNEEVANTVINNLEFIDKTSDIYSEIKEEAKKVIKDLSKNEFENSEDLNNAIITKANQIQALSEDGGDSKDKLASLLKLTVVKSKITPVKLEKEVIKPKNVLTELEQLNEKLRNNGLISTASVNNYPDSFVGKVYNDYKIDDYLRSGKMTSKTPIYFIAEPSIIEGVKLDMKDSYNEEDHLPIMAVVEDTNGSIIVGNKKYQPIGFMPRNSANSLGAARMDSIRKVAINQLNGQLLSINNVPIKTNGYIRAIPPLHTKEGTPNTSIHTIMNNDLSIEDKEILDNPNTPITEKLNVYNKAKKAILSKIKRVSLDNKRERIHLAYITPNMKGENVELELFISPPETTLSREGIPVLEVLTKGTPDKIILINSRISRYTKTLEDFFKNTPFDLDLRYKKEENNLVPVGESITKLSELSDKLTKKLNNFLTIPKGYEYKLIPTEEMLEGNRLFNLVVTNGENTISLFKVTNGIMTTNTKSSTILNLFLDGNSFRKEGSLPFVKWLVNYNDFNDKEGESEDNKKIRISSINDIFDDNILESSRESFKYTITNVEINSPFKTGEIPSTSIVVNSNNATSKPINTPTITSNDQVVIDKVIVDSETGVILKGSIKLPNNLANKTKTIITKLIDDGKSIKLAEDNSGYIDSNGKKYARVTSIIAADELSNSRFEANNPWGLPSSNIGTSIDEFVRDFFDNNLKENYPNISKEYQESFIKLLEGLKNQFEANGLTIIPRDIIVSGIINVTDSSGLIHEIPVAGTLDLLAYDNEGNLHIFDMKTVRSNMSKDKIDKYSKLLSLYLKFIEDKYGIKVASINIIPIEVNYDTPKGFKNGTTEYSIKEGTLLLANGKEFKESNPNLLEIGSLKYTELNVQYDKLLDSEKTIIELNLPTNTPIKEVKSADSTNEINPTLGLKIGKLNSRLVKPSKRNTKVIPSNNTWDLLSKDILESATKIGYTKDSWNNMSELEKEHQKKCLE